MRLRASFTVENAVIMPLFVVIIYVLVMVTFDMHDRVIMRSVDMQVAMKLEQEVYGDVEVINRKVLETAVSNIKIKSILDEDTLVSDMETRLEKDNPVTENRQPDFIRIISAGLKLIN